MKTGKIVVGITGASGFIYAERLILHILEQVDELLVIPTPEALLVCEQETNRKITQPVTCETLFGFHSPKIRLLDPQSFFEPPASGSFQHDGMVIIPCSMGTVGKIASGIANDLLARSADVCLKENRKLILVTRETPLNKIHLNNLNLLSNAGAVILPASPSFYSKPKTIEDAVDTVIARVLQQLDFKQDIVPEWGIVE